MDKRKLKRVLTEAKRAHHEYETNILKKRDEHWAGWYAAFILGKIPELKKPSRITKLLSKASKKHKKGDWTEFYAKYLIQNLKTKQ